MSLSSSTLAAIQQAGAAAYTADAELENAVKEYAARVNAAMSANPYGLGNDAPLENWKVVARFSQTLSGIELELKKIHHMASELTVDDQPRVHEIPARLNPSPRQYRKPLSSLPGDVQTSLFHDTTSAGLRLTRYGFLAGPAVVPGHSSPEGVFPCRATYPPCLEILLASSFWPCDS